MSEAPILFLDRARVAELLGFDDCITAVEDAFRLRGEGKEIQQGLLSFHVPGGVFHIKAGVLDLGHPYFVAKANGNFPGNPRAHGLPTIQGLIVLADGRDGRPLAVLDSGEVTLRRTAAASAVAAKYMARADARVATVCGCGEQGRVQLIALARVLHLERVHAFDRDPAKSRALAEVLSPALGLAIAPVDDLHAATRQSDVIVTSTTSTEFLLGPDDVRAGVFIAAVGTDNPDKREIHPSLMAAGKVVVDDFEQCARIGDLRHALEARAMEHVRLHGDLASVVAGRVPGRTSDQDIMIFDSTGIALEDAAASILVYERARDAAPVGAGA
ncbi:MAG TPA: ornithine cyclodeaminase family protein [Candidatus Eisenbacteria bacterium]|nr:ornithine cyclodeaminase family protein [Candidatus Eisenbacteria bacterium]